MYALACTLAHKQFLLQFASPYRLLLQNRFAKMMYDYYGSLAKQAHSFLVNFMETDCGWSFGLDIVVYMDSKYVLKI